MHFTSRDCHFWSVNFTHVEEELGNFVRILVGHLDIINMPGDSHLATTYLHVSYTRVVWINFKPISSEFLYQLLVLEEGTLEQSIQCLGQLYIKERFPLGTGGDVLPVQ